MKEDTIADINRIVHPSSVAIIGSSAKEGRLGRLYMDCFVFMGFEKIYPLNPHE